MSKLLISMVLILGTPNCVATVKDDNAEWRHIAQQAQHIMHDEQFKQAADYAICAIENAVVVGVEKFAAALSESEKEKVNELVTLVRAIFRLYASAVLAGNSDHYVELNQETQNKINILGNRLVITIMPLLVLSQEPAFMQANEQTMNEVRQRFFQMIDRATDIIAQELELQQMGE